MARNPYICPCGNPSMLDAGAWDEPPILHEVALNPPIGTREVCPRHLGVDPDLLAATIGNGTFIERNLSRKDRARVNAFLAGAR